MGGFMKGSERTRSFLSGCPLACKAKTHSRGWREAMKNKNKKERKKESKKGSGGKREK